MLRSILLVALLSAHAAGAQAPQTAAPVQGPADAEAAKQARKDEERRRKEEEKAAQRQAGVRCTRLNSKRRQ